jgi:dipeptide/tripeptide permease
MGPFLAGWIHSRMRVENVFRLAALSVFLMFIGVLIFFKEPRRIDEQQTTSIGQVVRNLLTVLGNGRFVLFLLIFSGYWIVFWQQYLILPIYIHDYVDANANTEIILIADPLVVITLTVAVNALTRRISSFGAITLGTLITGVAWLVLGLHASVWTAVVALIIVALGEITQQPRYYEYISRLAPSGQQGTYMGFAFLPIAHLHEAVLEMQDRVLVLNYLIQMPSNIDTRPPGLRSHRPRARIPQEHGRVRRQPLRSRCCLSFGDHSPKKQTR